jgi:acyl-coenzyme A thioesterase PaaI-like protein
VDHEAVLDAAAALRRAVHDLALASTGGHHEPAALAAATRLVAEAAAVLDGERLAPWWDGPAVAQDRLGLRAYRHRSLFQGPLHPFSPALSWIEAEPVAEGPTLAFTVTLSALYEGPPRAVHGGYLAALFDELLGGVQGRARDGGGYTGRLTIRYRALTPVDEPLVFTGWITSDKGRRITTAATCRTADDCVTAEAEGLFVRPTGS